MNMLHHIFATHSCASIHVISPGSLFLIPGPISELLLHDILPHIAFHVWTLTESFTPPLNPSQGMYVSDTTLTYPWPGSLIGGKNNFTRAVRIICFFESLHFIITY